MRNTQNLKMINIWLPKDFAEEIKKWNEKHLLNTTAFIKIAIKEKLDRDNQ